MHMCNHSLRMCNHSLSVEEFLGFIVVVCKCNLLLPVVCWSVCQSITVASPAKMAKPTEMPFGMWTRVDPRKHVSAIPGEYDSTIHLLWRCRLMSYYFDHLFLLAAACGHPRITWLNTVLDHRRSLPYVRQLKEHLYYHCFKVHKFSISASQCSLLFWWCGIFLPSCFKLFVKNLVWCK